jgi:hypothetical protein
MEETSVEFVVEGSEAPARSRRSASDLTGWETVIFELEEERAGE